MRRKNKRKLTVLLILLLFTDCALPVHTVYAAPTETKAARAESQDVSPVENQSSHTAALRHLSIGTADELLAFAENCTLDTWSHNLEVTLTADIRLGDKEFTSIPTFGGTFNGNGHTVSGVLINETGSARGFFRYIQPSGIIKELKLEGVTLSGGSRENIGGIAGINYGCIENCSFSGTVIGQTQTGGIAGLNESTGVILSSRADGDITGEHFTGGIAGKNLGVISSCTNNCNVNTNNPETKMNLENFDMEHLNSTENINSYTDTGGITGYSSGIVKSCTNLGTIGYRHTGYNVGGIAGRQNGFLSGCSNQADIFGRKDVGGIAGQAEPYLIMEFSEDTLQQLDTEVTKMHDIIDSAAGHLSENAALVSTQLNTLTGQFRLAGDSIHTVTDSLVEFTNGSVDTLNDTGGRIGSLTRGTEQMLGGLGSSSADLNRAAEQMHSSLDKLHEEKEVANALTEKVKQILALFQKDSDSLHTSVADTADAVSGLSSARSALGSYSSMLWDTVSGSTLPETEKARMLSDIGAAENALSSFDDTFPAASWKASDVLSSVVSYTGAQSEALAPLGQKITAQTLQTAADSLAGSRVYVENGREQAEELKGLTEPVSQSLTRAAELLTGVYAELPDTLSVAAPPAAPSLSDLLNALQKMADTLGGSAGTIDEIVKILKEMIPYFDQAGNIASDSLDYLKRAFTDMSSGFSHVGEAIDTMHGAMSGLAGRPDISFPKFNSSGSAAIDTLFSSVTDAADTISLLNDTMNRLGDTAAADLQAINNQLQVIIHLLIDTRNTENTVNVNELIEDVSGDGIYEHTEGRISDCINNGTVDGDIDTGGIIGMMAQEYDFDPEDDINNIGQRSMSFKYKTRAVVSSCINRGELKAKKDQLGGIVGRMDLGTVIDCQNYGPAASDSGDYIGGIAGYSSSVIKNCYSLCSLTGNNYIGGIAGSGYDIQSCYSLVTVDSTGEALGAIAGLADGDIVGNFFVSDSLAGIDGISYEGAAVPEDYESLLETAGLPSEFRNFKLRFVADEKVVANISVAYGSGLPPDEIPEVPAKEGYYASWPDFDYGCITGSAVLEAQYTPWVTVIASDMTRADSGLPIFLVEGEFAPDAVLEVLSLDGSAELPDKSGIAEAWKIQVTGMKAPDTALTLRCIVPDMNTSYDVLLLENGQWKKLPCEKDGSYLVFSVVNESEIALAVTHGKKAVFFAVIPPVLLLCIAVFLFTWKKKVPSPHTGRNKKHTAVKSRHIPHNG